MAIGLNAKGQKQVDLEKILKSKIDELTALYEVSESITSSANLDRMLLFITRKVSRLMRAAVCAIHLVERKRLILRHSFGIRGYKWRLKETLRNRGNVVALSVRNKKPHIVKDILRSSNCGLRSIMGRRNCVRSLLVVPLIERGSAIGALSIFSDKPDAYARDDVEELNIFASQIAIATENARLFEQMKLNYLNIMKLLASIIDAKDSYTEDHSEKVMKFAVGIAKKMNLSDKMKSAIRYAALLHDIGKLNIDIGILRKPGPLTDEEWAKVIEHPKVGANMIKRAGFLDELVPIILYHHVRFSGGGYPPCRKKGNAIPIAARILAVADAYEAMTSARPYRSCLTKEEAVGELKRTSGTQFDPKVVKAFLKWLNRKPKK